MEEATMYWSGNFSANSFNYQDFINSGIQFNYSKNRLTPEVLKFSTFYLAGCINILFLSDKLFDTTKRIKNFITSLLLFFSITILLIISESLKLPKYNLVNIFFIASKKALLILLVILIYEIIKRALFSQVIILKNHKSQLSQRLQYILLAIFIWLILIVACTYFNISKTIGIIVGIIVPFLYLTFITNAYWLFPYFSQKRTKSWVFYLSILIAALVLNLPFSIFLSSVSPSSWPAYLIFLFLAIIQIGIILPLGYYLFNAETAKRFEIDTLKLDAIESSTSYRSLKAQINPHFLFNALNTLNGLAETEGSENTAKGIQMLGNMMRFMLHDNLSDRILLRNELDYLNNYIELQRLRFLNSEFIVVNVETDNSTPNKHVAPMLLIPFVENAFKHGISMRQPNSVKVGLKCKEGIVELIVCNSVHVKIGLQTPQERSGVGLDNVSQRLALLYPEKHELLITQTTDKFEIKLIINLNGESVE
jgi:two-component system LytT family sensor kinase